MPVLSVWMASALAAGAAAGLMWPTPAWTAGLSVAAALVSAAGVVWTRPRVTLVGGLVALATLGVVRGQQTARHEVRPTLLARLEAAGCLGDDGESGASPGEPVEIAGTLLGDAALVEQTVRLRIAVERVWLGPCGCAEPVEGTVLATVAGDHAADAHRSWSAGRHVRLTAMVRRARGFRNTGAPTPEQDVVQRGYALVASVKSPHLVQLVAAGSPADEVAAVVRAHVRRAIRLAAGEDATAAALGTAVTIGDRAGLDPALVVRLRAAGTYHVVAISGGNIALVVVVVMWSVGRLSRRRAIGAAMAGAVLVAYALIVGGGASVVRATGMALVGLAAIAMDVRGAAVNVLALTALALITAEPRLAVDVGFWLSAAATAGLLVGLGRTEDRRPAWPRRVAAACLATCWAHLALLPILARVFQQVGVAGLVLNLAAVPGSAFVQIGGALAASLGLVSAALVPLAGAPLRLGTWLIVAPAAIVERWSWLAWHVSPPSSGVVLGYYACVAFWLWTARPGSGLHVGVRRLGYGAMTAAVVWVAAAPLDFVRRTDGLLHLTTFDVGQGDAHLVELPDGTRLLVDAGAHRPGGFDVGARVVAPALRARGIRQVDYVLVTHADGDHIGGAASIVRAFGPREVWVGIDVADHPLIAELHAAAAQVRAAWRPLRDRQRLEVAGVRLEALHPPEPDWERQRVRNDDSVVLAVAWRQVRILLTGDVGAQVERALLPALRAWAPEPALTVLKVAHHGSATSSDGQLLAELRPAVAVVSLGADNPFGHPAPAVVERLDRAGAALWRTDVDGEVHLRTDGHAVEVSSIAGRRAWYAASSDQPR